MTNVADRRGVSPSQARFAERARARRRRVWRAILGCVLVAAMVTGCVWLVGFSSVLTVTHVRVEGVSGPEAGVLSDIGKAWTGIPLARVDTGSVARQARSQRAIAEASASRSWPHTLVIRAVHRTPALVLQNPNGQLEVVDASGVGYADVTSAPAGVPLVRATGAADVGDDALHAALSVGRALPPALNADVSDITVSPGDEVSFKRGTTQVVWGDAADPELKVRIIAALLKAKPAPHLIDVSAPETPVSK